MTLQHAGDIIALEFLHDGYLASSNGNGEVTLWETATGTRVRAVDAHSYITCFSASRTRLAFGTRDNTVQMWDAAPWDLVLDATSWKCISSFECDDWVRSVALIPSCERVAACTEEMIYVWEMVTQQLIARNLSRGRDVAVSRDGKWLAVASSKTILYDASTLDCIWSHDIECNSVSFSPDSHQLVCGHSGGVQLLNVQAGSRVNSFQHESVQRAVFFHDGTRVISGKSCSFAL